MTMDRIKRRGLIAELEEDLDRVERRLKGIAGSINDATFAIGSHLDTDGKAVEQYGREYRECQDEGRRIRAKIEELKDA